VATGSGGLQAGVVDGAEATKDGTAGTSDRGHAGVTTGTVGVTNVGNGGGSKYCGVNSHGGAGR